MCKVTQTRHTIDTPKCRQCFRAKLDWNWKGKKGLAVSSFPLLWHSFLCPVIFLFQWYLVQFQVHENHIGHESDVSCFFNPDCLRIHTRIFRSEWRSFWSQTCMGVNLDTARESIKKPWTRFHRIYHDHSSLRSTNVSTCFSVKQNSYDRL